MTETKEPVVPTGVPGLDEILAGGLPRGHLYLLEGDAGAGKTTLGLQFLLEGIRRDERALWLSLSETESQLLGTAQSHGWDLSRIHLVNLTRVMPNVEDGDYSFFSPADVELAEVTKAILATVERLKPTRVVFDPFSDVRLLARDPLRYRKSVLQLREFFSDHGVTALLIQELTVRGAGDPSAEGIVQGIIALHQLWPEFGGQRRRMRVHKLRGVHFRDGFHDIKIEPGGLRAFPRLVAMHHSVHSVQPERAEVSSGVDAVDQMLGGGVERGASVLILGPAGVGKSTLSNQFALAAASRRERVALFLFDETERAFQSRAQGLGFPVEELVAQEMLIVRQMDPATFSPGEFAHEVQCLVETLDVKLISIDSLNGFMNGMPDERHLSLHLHELLTYLSYHSVVTMIPVNQHGFVGSAIQAPIDISYLADIVIVLRYFESDGAVRRAASVMKRRCGPHEVHIREMTIGKGGVQVGGIISEIQGVLSGQPLFTGSKDPLSGGNGGAHGQVG